MTLTSGKWSPNKVTTGVREAFKTGTPSQRPEPSVAYQPPVEPIPFPPGREPGCDDEPAPAEAKPDDHTFIWLDDFCQQPPSTSWLVREYLELDSLAAIFGDSEAGKSFLAIDLSCHIAHGIAWRGHKVNKGIVLYIAGEGQNGLKRRFKAWHEHHNLPVKKNIAVRTIPAALCEPAKASQLVEYIKKLIASIGTQPVFIVIDTLNRNFGNGNENDTKDMTAFVSGMDCIRTATGACLMVVHHCGHGDKSRMRAAISLHNAVDSEYLVAREGDRQEISSLVTTITNTKTKEGGTPKPLSWNWRQQALPWAELDDQGYPVPLYSAVLVPTDFVEPVKGKRLGAREKRALEAFDRLLEDHRANLEADGRDGKNALVKLSDWLIVVKTIEPESGNRSKLIKSLESKELIYISDGYVKKP